MRSLLTFTGSVIHLLVLVIIWPLLLLVYTGLETVAMVQYIKSQKLHLSRGFFHTKMPSVQLPAKRYFQTLWTKAVRFHL
jgi:uncharacterized membrane protein YdbT with pleckstrin-like domain